MLGQTISHYRIVSELGRGGMGEVYLAEDTRLGRKVALKFLSSDLIENAEALIRFRREATAAAALSHPNIATLFDVGEAEGRSFLVLEYLEGTTLRDRLRRAPLSIEETVRVGQALASGVTDRPLPRSSRGLAETRLVRRRSPGGGRDRAVPPGGSTGDIGESAAGSGRAGLAGASQEGPG